VRETLRATNPRGYMHGVKLGLVDGYDPETVAAKVAVPLLMISGAEDRVNPIDKNAAVLAKAMPKRNSKFSRGIGHLPEGRGTRQGQRDAARVFWPSRVAEAPRVRWPAIFALSRLRERASQGIFNTLGWERELEPSPILRR